MKSFLSHAIIREVGGNASTEDLAFMLEEMGIGTDVDIEGLQALSNELAQWLPDETLHGSVSRAGLPKTFAARADLDYAAGGQ